jgi:tetratricopeptide (TPR) repeat protein
MNSSVSNAFARTRSILRDSVVAGCLIGIASALLHFGTLDNDFVFDDIPAIVENPVVNGQNDSNAIGAAFTTNYWGNRPGFESLTTWRPLTSLTFQFDHWIHGPNPVAFHAVNLMVHALVVCLVFIFVFTWIGRRSVALVAAGLFAVMPVHVEVIAGAVNRAELLAAAFYLGATILYLLAGARQKDTKQAYLFTGTLLCFALGLLTKEHVITWPAAIAIIEGAKWIRFRENPSQNRWPRWPPYWVLIGVLLIIAGYMYARSAVLPTILAGDASPADNPLLAEGVSLWTRMLTVGKLYFYYLQLLVAPLNLTVDYTVNAVPLPMSLGDADAFAGCILLVVTIVGVMVTLRRLPELAAALLLYLMLFTLIGNVVFLNSILMAERLMYLPSVAWCVVVGLVVATVWDGVSWRMAVRRTLLVGCLVVAGSYAYRSMVRVADWRTDLTLFRSAVAAYPDSARARVNLARQLFDRRQIDEAEKHLLAAVGLDPYRAETHNLLGLVQWNRGQVEKALKHFVHSDRIQTSPGVKTNLCRARLESAKNRFRRPECAADGSVPPSDHFCDCLAKFRGECAKAARVCEKAAALEPNSALVFHNLGMSRMVEGNKRAALKALQRAREIEPNNKAIQLWLKQAQSMPEKPTDRCAK